jgi:hypothetical protein
MPDGRPYTPEAYAYSPVRYVGESGSIPALLLYEAGGLSYVRFRVTSAWPHYDGWSKWTNVGLFTEHVVTADPHEPAVADLLGELEREAAAQQQHLANCRHRANGQGASDRGKTISKQEKGQEAPSSGIEKLPPAVELPAKQRESSKGKLNGEEFPSRKSADSEILKKYGPARTIGGLCLKDFQ